MKIKIKNVKLLLEMKYRRKKRRNMKCLWDKGRRMKYKSKM